MNNQIISISEFDNKAKQKCITALNELHSYDVLHRDIHFSNFIINDNTAVIICVSPSIN